MSNVFDRPKFPVTLPDGRTCEIQRVGAVPFTQALRASTVTDEIGVVELDVTLSNIGYWSTLCFHGMVDHGKASPEEVGSDLSEADLRFIAKRIEFRSDMCGDPDAPQGDPAWDAKLPSTPGKEAVDPLVDEFPAHEHAAGAGVGDHAAALRDVPLPAGSGGVAGPDAGDAPIHGGAGVGAAEASGVADGS